MTAAAWMFLCKRVFVCLSMPRVFGSFPGCSTLIFHSAEVCGPVGGSGPKVSAGNNRVRATGLRNDSARVSSSVFSPPSFSLLHASLFPSISLLCSLHKDGDRLVILSQGALRVWLTALTLNLNLPFVSVAAPSFVNALPCSLSFWVITLHFKSISFSTVLYMCNLDGVSISHFSFLIRLVALNHWETVPMGGLITVMMNVYLRSYSNMH